MAPMTVGFRAGFHGVRMFTEANSASVGKREVARIALDPAEVPSVVVGIGVGMEGGMEGVQL